MIDSVLKGNTNLSSGKSIFPSLLLISVAFLAVNVGLTACVRQDPKSEQSFDSRSKTITNTPKKKHSAINEEAGVEFKFEEREKVPVIVLLDVDFTPEGYLSDEKLQKQRQRIGLSQDEIISSLSEIDYSINRKYETSPMLALSIPEEGFKKLMDHPEVRRIKLDKKSTYTSSN